MHKTFRCILIGSADVGPFLQYSPCTTLIKGSPAT
jgi:hypothetical protein